MPEARNAVVAISAFFSGGWNAGSGVIVDANTILTTMHFLVHNGETASSVTITYTTADGNTREITVGSNAIHLNIPAADWLASNALSQAQSGQDYAAISLPNPIGLSTGWFDLDTDFHLGQVRISGYPVVRDSPAERAYEEVGGFYVDAASGTNASELLNITPATFGPGYSGGAVWRINDGEPDLVGIISAGNSNRGRSADISPQSAPKIIEWMSSDDGLVAGVVNRAHVTKVFEVGFGREPTASELNYWAGQLSGNLTLADAYSLAATSPQVQVNLLYDTLFNSLPTQLELNDWVGKMGRGMPLQDVGASLLRSPAFLSTPGAQNSEAFVDQLSTNILGYTLNGAERDYWVGVTEQNGRLSVLDAVSDQDTNTLHISIVGSINLLDAGVFLF